VKKKKKVNPETYVNSTRPSLLAPEVFLSMEDKVSWHRPVPSNHGSQAGSLSWSCNIHNSFLKVLPKNHSD
jgi:hypothetical protein